MSKPLHGLIALTTIAICVALVAYADALRQARAEQLTAQACAVCVEKGNDCAAVCGAGGKPREEAEPDAKGRYRAPVGGRTERARD